MPTTWQANSNIVTGGITDQADSVTDCTDGHPVGRMTGMTDASGDTVWCHDARGNITRKAQTVAQDTLTVQYDYDLADRLSGLVTPSGVQVTYMRDPAGQIEHILQTDGSHLPQAVVRDAHHLPFGPVATYTLGNQQVLARSHDLDYQVTDVTSPALELHFRRDPVGNIDRLGTAPGAASPIEDYAYDDLYRLEAVQDDQAADIEAYTYDLIGNRQSKTTAAGTELYGYVSDSHRLIDVDGQTRSYDAVGNLITNQAGDHTYSYGDHNRLTGYSDPGHDAAYLYNGLGERVAKSVDDTRQASGGVSTHFVYDEAGRLLGEGPPSSVGQMRHYIYLGDIPVGLIQPGGGRYLHADHLGTPRAVTDSAGVKYWEWEFQANPFGEQLPDEDPENTGSDFILNLRFPGQYYDAESELHYNYFRDYEPGTGRYMQSDPIGLAGGISTYGYANQNPLLYIDPFGLFGGFFGCSGPCGPQDANRAANMARASQSQQQTRSAQQYARQQVLRGKVLSGNAGGGGSIFVGVLGFSGSTGLGIDTNLDAVCSVTNLCVQCGLGAFGGAGFEGTGGVSDPLSSGTSDSFGLFINFAPTAGGPAGGGSINFGEGSASGTRGFLGGGVGASAGVQFCRTYTACTGE